MRHVFIVNSKAGNGKYKDFIKFISDFKDKYNLFIEVTNKEDEITDVIKKYENLDKLRFYSVGGDGTLNVLLNKLTNKDIPIGIVPHGTGNDLAYLIYGEKKWDYKANIEKLINGNVKNIDMGVVNDKFFINIASVGFDAEVGKEANKLKRFLFFPKIFAYYVSIVKVLYKKKSAEYKVSIDGKDFSGEYLLIAIANGKYYGGGIIPAPKAKIDDGYFDVCLVSNISRVGIMKLLPLYKAGKHTNLDLVKMERCKTINIEQDNVNSLNLDGDIYYSKINNFRILEKKFKLILPN